MNIPQTLRAARSLQTAKNWHDNHYERTTPDSHQGRWRRFIVISRQLSLHRSSQARAWQMAAADNPSCASKVP